MAEIGALLRAATARLADAGVDDPAGDARRLMARHVREPVSARLGDMLDPGAVTLFEADIAARAARRPVSHILGWRDFWGRRFEVSADVLDPRPDTETLIEAALAGPAPRRILDLGTGSGAILATLLAEWPGATGLATDLSEAALAVARRNLVTHAPGRWQAVRADWFDGIDGRFDLIVSNPPYIDAATVATLAPEVRQHEPHMALTPGGDGLDAYRAIAAGWRDRLEPGGRMLLEIGHDQGRSAADLFAPARVDLLHDIDGRPRVLAVTP